MSVVIIKPASLWAPAEMVQFTVELKAEVATADEPVMGDVQIFAGQPDPADPARFTIPFEVDGTPGTLDARLQDGGNLVTVAVRTVRATGAGGASVVADITYTSKGTPATTNVRLNSIEILKGPNAKTHGSNKASPRRREMGGDELPRRPRAAGARGGKEGAENATPRTTRPTTRR